MHLIDGAGHVNNQFVSEDVATGRPPTEITADIMNALQNELANVILSSGMSLSKVNNAQLTAALNNTFAKRDNTIHYIEDVWEIVADQAALASVGPMPEGTRILVTSYYGPYQAAIVTITAGTWIDTPIPLNIFDLYGTLHDNHGYYWFSNTWNLFDVATIQVEQATEEVHGIVRLATWTEVLAKSLGAVAIRPAHMADYIDRVFVGQLGDFSGVTAPAVWIPASGQLVSRSERPLLWEYAQASGNIIADGAWSSNTGKFSTGNDISTFRVPDLRGEFRQGWDNGRGLDAGRAIGAVLSDSIRAHHHMTDGTDGSNRHVVRAGFDSYFDYSSAKANNNDAEYVAGSRTGDTGGSVTRPRSVAYSTHIYAGKPA
jgi:microcystin-dependent protein